jgi:signal peptidase
MRWVWRALAWSIALTSLVLAVILVGARVLGYQMMTVQTGSMSPTFNIGDVIISRPIQTRRLKPGMVISYHAFGARDYVLSHRLVEVNAHTGQLVTAGDRLQTPDAPILPGRVIGQTVAGVPHAGRPITWLRQPWLLDLVIYMPAVWLVVNELGRLQDHWHLRYSLRRGLKV